MGRELLVVTFFMGGEAKLRGIQMGILGLTGESPGGIDLDRARLHSAAGLVICIRV
jgi:hypothetical protein